MSIEVVIAVADIEIVGWSCPFDASFNVVIKIQKFRVLSLTCHNDQDPLNLV